MKNSEEQWTNEQWRKNTLAYIYHLLLADPNKHWAEVMSLFVVAVRKHQTFAIEIIERMSLDDVCEELSREQNETVQSFRQQMHALTEGNLRDGFEMFDKLCGMAALTSQAKGYVLAYRGECYRLAEIWEKALLDFTNALQYTPDDGWTITSRGVTYTQMEH